MAKPIKERGIQWEEQYGDKSAYLKREMEDQIGPGAYFRWEGHDFITGNDYYVVVSPGYSSKHGYHFFAGLRKIPAEHGASGKEFNTMREALHYAYDMWRVPKPDTMPPGWTGYRYEDIVNKEIVEEGKKASSWREVKVSEMTLRPEADGGRIEHTGMSVQTMQSQFDPRVGPRVSADQYCFAYGASPLMGFLPALYSRMRFTGVDGQNFDPRGASKVVNMLGDGPIPGTKGNRPDERPPLIATCQEPDEATFNKYYPQSVTNERLYDMPEKFGDLPKDWWLNPEKYRDSKHLYPEFKDSYGGDDSPNVKNYRWGNMDIKMRFKIPAKALDDQILKEWNARFVRAYQDSVTAQAKAAQQVEGNPDAAALAHKAESAGNIDDIIQDISGSKRGEAKGSQISGNLGGKEFEVLLKARDIGLYDQFIAAMRQHIEDTTGSEYQIRDYAKGRTSANFMRLYRRSQEILQSGDQELIERFNLQNGFDFDQVYHQKLSLEGSQTLTYDEQGMPIALAVDEAGGKAWRQEGKAKRVGTRYVLKDPIATIDKAVPGFAKTKEQGDEEAAQELLSKFHRLAAANKVPITHKDVYDARTVAPLLSNPETPIPKMDDYRLPKVSGEGAGTPGDIAKMTDFEYENGPMAKPYYVQATQETRTNEHGQTENVFAARYFDPKLGKYAYGPIPVDAKLDVHGRQQFDGVPTQTPNAKMFVSRPDGEPYAISRNEFQLYDTDSCGKFIPGDYYDINLGPKGVTPMGWQRDGVNVPDGFEIRERAHKAEWSQEKGTYMSRQQSSDPFTTAQIEAPGMDPDDYSYKSGRRYTYTDNYPLMLYLKDKLKLPNNITEPFTRMTMMDLKVVQEKIEEGKRFYRDNKRRFDRYKDASEVPDEDKADYDRYVYGKTVANCGGETVPGEVFKALGKELEDPAGAMRPKEGELWALMARPPEGSEEKADWVRMENHGILFAASERMAQLDMNMPGVKALQEKGWEVIPLPYAREDGISYGLPSVNTYESPQDSFVYGAENFIEYTAGTFPAHSLDEAEVDSPLPEDEELALPEEVSEAEDPEEYVPETEEMPGLAPLPGRPQQSTPAPPAEPEGMRPAPRRETPPPAQYPGPKPRPARKPKPRGAPPAQPAGTGEWPSLGLEEDIYSSVRPDRLVALADKLDRQGRHKEADAVDRAIRRLADRGRDA